MEFQINFTKYLIDIDYKYDKRLIKLKLKNAFIELRDIYKFYN